MIQNNFQVLPFYKNINEQHHRKPYAFGVAYPLYCPTTGLLPFQLSILHVDADTIVKSAVLYTLNGEYVSDIAGYLNSALNVEQRSSDTDTIILPYLNSGDLAPGTAPYIKEGFAYLRLETNAGEIFFSEVLCFVSNIDDYVKVEWRDLSNLQVTNDSLLYGSGFTNIMYLNTIIGKPKYDFDEEGEDRNGYFFAEKQLSKKTYKFAFAAPEYLCDAIRLIRLSDIIEITSGGQTLRCDSFTVEPEWEEQGDLAAVEVEFTTGTVVKKIAAGWPK